MNWLGCMAVILAFPLFALGWWTAKQKHAQATDNVCWCLGVLTAIPACIYFLYYTKILGEPIWLYQLRTIQGSELFASTAGFLAGWAQVRVVPRLKLSRLGQRLLIPVLLGFLVAVPYLKPLLRSRMVYLPREQWSDGVRLQSTASTCGPASAATVLHALGIEASEQELAAECYTCTSGTENWYLARALRRRGFATRFLFSKELNAPLPAIAGVRLKDNSNSGHFIAVLSKLENEFVFGDPMTGRFTNTIADLSDQYEFTGFMLSIEPRHL